MTTQVPETTGPPGTGGPSSVVDAARDEGRTVAQTARTETARLAERGRQEVREQADTQTRRVAEGVRDLGRQLHRLGEGEGPAEGPVADLVREAADRADRLAGRIDEGGIDRITADLKQLARRRPVMYLAGAFAVGIVAGRLFRNADTGSLAEAVRPDGGSDDRAGGGAEGGGQPYDPDRTVTAPVGSMGDPAPSDWTLTETPGGPRG